MYRASSPRLSLSTAAVWFGKDLRIKLAHVFSRRRALGGGGWGVGRREKAVGKVDDDGGMDAHEHGVRKIIWGRGKFQLSSVQLHTMRTC